MPKKIVLTLVIHETLLAHALSEEVDCETLKDVYHRAPARGWRRVEDDQDHILIQIQTDNDELVYMLETDLDTALEHFINQEGFLPGKTTFGIEIELSTQNMGPEISWAGDPDQNARQAPSFRAGKDSADAVGVLWSVSVASVVVRCTGE